MSKEQHSRLYSIKKYFTNLLDEKLNFQRVSAPLFIDPESGLQDGLNGNETAVSFIPPHCGVRLEIVHSLAKWKRVMLEKLKFELYEGLYTDMNAIRPDERLDKTHSLYVDQWDWEMVIVDRNMDSLKSVVQNIYSCIGETVEEYNYELSKGLPTIISFITTTDLYYRYPSLPPKERENMIAKQLGAVFIMQIGGRLPDGTIHDNRAPDYDDWELNGDIVVWNPILGEAFELSSMGIRVDRESLIRQMGDKPFSPYHNLIVENKLPQTIGGGIGQSRLCQFIMGAKHIAEVQCSWWAEPIENAL